ncbi:vitamin K epoxide reductase family protein [Nocardioides sp. NPDC101246]|uniref:vitamin K epoxide reductase family protein n=1 Tax=Nocardioides sp. NPDC101246 TaxID=3364336 RepID=UPI003821BD8F
MNDASSTQEGSPAASTAMGWGLILGGLIGLVAAAALLIERFKLAQDSSYTPVCSLNPVVSCGSVMESAQAAVLGFPNPLIGVAAFPVLITTGAAILAGARFRRWFWLGLQAGVTAGLAFIAWLIFQSLYRIGALCPYCMVVWIVVVPTFWYVTLHNLRHGVFGERAARSRAAEVADVWHAPILLAAFLAILALIAVRFWDYWSTLI